MTWDKTTPQGSEAISLGDDRIRELKDDLEDALTVEHAFPISTSAPGLIYTPSRGNTASRPTGTYLVTGRLYINTQTGCIERYNGATWDEVNTQPADDTIALVHMSANSVDSDQYVDGSIDLIHMSVNSVDSDQYVDGSIDLIHMSSDSIDSDQYVDGSIDRVHLSADIIDGTKLADDAVDSEHIADGAIDVAHLSAGVLALMTIASVQRFSTAITLSGSSQPDATVAGSANQTISSIDTTKTVLLFGGVRAAADAAYNPGWLTAGIRLTSATNVAIVCNGGGDASNEELSVIVDFEVLEFN